MTMGCQAAVARNEPLWRALWDAGGFDWLRLVSLYPRFMYSESCCRHKWSEHSPQCQQCTRHQEDVEAILQNECVYIDPSKYGVSVMDNEPAQFNALKAAIYADGLKLCLCPPPMKYAGAQHPNFVVPIANIDCRSPAQ